MSRSYVRFSCPLCGKQISNAGIAQAAHYRKHAREGLVVEQLRVPGEPWKGLFFQWTAEGRQVAHDRMRAEIARRKAEREESHG